VLEYKALGDGPNDRIETGCVSAARKYADSKSFGHGVDRRCEVQAGNIINESAAGTCGDEN
jgi:hypothetical protein